MKLKRALVTGATGFVGSNLVRGLLNEDWQVDVIVRQSSSLDQLLDVENKLNIHHFNGQMGKMLDIVSESSPDVVFHIASMVIVEHKSEQLEELLSSNILYGSQLLESMVLNGVTNFINTGTYWDQYRNKKYSPVNLYAATKYAFQNLLQYYVEAGGVNAVTLKLFDSYGPSDSRPKLINLLKKLVETGEPLSMSPGDQKINLVHIDDVVSAYLVAANKLINREVEGHKIYSVAGEQAVTLKELVAIFERITGKALNIKWGRRSYRDREVMVPCEHHKTLPGWKPGINIETGVETLLFPNRVR